jgi:excisionase family DNA binding protein
VLTDCYLDLANSAPEYCSCSTRTLRRRAKEGCFGIYKVGGKRLVKKSEIDQWIESQRQEIQQPTLKSLLATISSKVLKERNAS